MAKKNQASEYLTNHVKKPLEVIVKRVLKKKPAEPIPLILSALEECQGLKYEPLDDNERIELDALRNQFEYLRTKLARLEGEGPAQPIKLEESKSAVKHGKMDHDSDTEESEDSEGTLAPLPDKKKGMNRKPRGSVSAEAFGSWNKKGDFTAVIVPKNDETKEKIRSRLSKSFLFNSLDEKDFEIVIDAMNEVKLNPGDCAIKEGDDGDFLYVVEIGKLQCSKIFPGNTEPTNLIIYEPGGAFGELALLYNAPRAATITAIDQ
jgi:hypothetical protein